MRNPAPETGTIVIGIDPGLAALGYGVVRAGRRNSAYLDAGTITTSSKSPYSARLKKLYDEMLAVFTLHRPAAVVMERPIYCQNVRTALSLGQAGGAAILAAAAAGIELVEFTPLEVKRAVTGKGNASKEQVQKMVELILRLEKPLGSEHESDALACAICYAHGLGSLIPSR